MVASITLMNLSVNDAKYLDGGCLMDRFLKTKK